MVKMISLETICKDLIIIVEMNATVCHSLKISESSKNQTSIGKRLVVEFSPTEVKDGIHILDLLDCIEFQESRLP